MKTLISYRIKTGCFTSIGSLLTVTEKSSLSHTHTCQKCNAFSAPYNTLSSVLSSDRRDKQLVHAPPKMLLLRKKNYRSRDSIYFITPHAHRNKMTYKYRNIKIAKIINVLELLPFNSQSHLIISILQNLIHSIKSPKLSESTFCC